MPSRLVSAATPIVFVLIWSTGFVVAHLVTGTIGPLTFLSIRFALAALVLAAIAAATGARWPADRRAWRDAAVSGILIQALYLGGIFWAVAQGLPAALSALIAGAQPLLTAIVAWPLLREHVSARRWAGILLGLAGIALVLGPRMQASDAIPPIAFVVAILSTCAITAGTIWQKRTGSQIDLATGTAIQYAAAFPVVLLAALAIGERPITPSPALWLGLAWSVLALSVGAVGLFLWMLKQGAVVGVASLLFLVPPITAAMGYAMFGDTLVPIQLVGMAVAMIGVAVTSRR